MVPWSVRGANSREQPPGTWLDRMLKGRRPHPLVFACGVRVVSGEVAGLRARWRFRDSAIDPLVVAGRVTVQFGSSQTLRLERIALAPTTPSRPGHVVLSAVDATTGAGLELSVPSGEAITLGVEL